MSENGSSPLAAPWEICWCLPAGDSFLWHGPGLAEKPAVCCRCFGCSALREGACALSRGTARREHAAFGVRNERSWLFSSADLQKSLSGKII